MKRLLAVGVVVAVQSFGIGSSFAQAEKKIVAPPAPSKTHKFTVSSGDGQKAVRMPGTDGVARAAFAPLRVSVKDAAGKPIYGASIQWKCSAKAPLTCDIGKKTSAITSPSGEATLAALDQGTHSLLAAGGEGTIQVQAAYGSVAKITFSLQVIASNVLTIASGDAQEVERSENTPAGVTAFEPLSVKLTDAAGTALAGRKVLFACSVAGGAVCETAPKSTSTEVTTGADGVATLKVSGGKSVLVSKGIGTVSVQASAADVVKPVAFSLVAKEQAPRPTITILSGDNQAMPLVERSNHEVFAKFPAVMVMLKDPAGKPLANQVITWTCPGCQTVTSRTDADGKSKGGWWGGDWSLWISREGPVTLTATYANATANFHFTVLPRAATPRYKLSIVSGDKQEVAVGPYGALFAPLVVKLVDENGKPIPKQWVGARCAPVGGACNLTFLGSYNSVMTAADGTASFSQMTTSVIKGANGANLYNGASGGTVRAVADDSNPVVFELNVKK